MSTLKTQLADILTKALDKLKFIKIHFRLGVRSVACIKIRGDTVGANLGTNVEGDIPVG